MPRLWVAMAIILGLSVILSVSSCRRLKVGADLEDIEWVIVDGHDAGAETQWVAKLRPDKDARLIRELMTAINGAKWKGATTTDGDGFIVFKLKWGGAEPMWMVYLLWADWVPWQVTQWALAGYL